MKKRSILQKILLVFLVVFTGLLFFACEKTSETVSDTEIVDTSVLTVHNGTYLLNEYGNVEDLDFSEITFKVEYKNGESKLVTLDETMLSADDRAKFEKIGDHTLFINYEGQQIPFTISVREDGFTEIYDVMFVSMGGSTVPNQKTSIIKTFITPVRENYTFDGWYDNQDFSGEKLTVPFRIEKNTTFFAKWIDNRRCNVKFIDIDDTVIYDFDVVYGASIDPNDSESYKDPPEKFGWTFNTWRLSSGGDYYEITEDLIFVAEYDRVKCFVTVEDKENGFYNKEFDYGSKIDISDFTLEQKEGYTARWVVYIDDSENYVELTDEQLEVEGDEITINHKQMDIIAFQTINTYKITAYNGDLNQEEENLRSGNIKTVEVFDEDGLPFKKDYGEEFILYRQDGKKDLDLIEIEGYDVDWCYITKDEDGGDIWRNRQNQIWNDDTKMFEGDITNNYDLFDKDGNKLARIEEGNIVDIQGQVTIRPKYQKESYTVELRKTDESGINYYVYKSFEVKYYTDFALYDPSLAEYNNEYQTWTEVEDSYLKYTVSDFLTNDVVKENNWQNSKWKINWFTKPTTSDDYKVDFRYDEVSGELGKYTVKNNVELYAQDVDTRTYSLTVYYNYNFETGEYDSEIAYDDLTPNEQIDLPQDIENSITNDNIEYSFLGYFNYPYEGPNIYHEDDNDSFDENDYIYYNGIQTYYPKAESNIVNWNYHNKNEVYYVHYYNKITYNINIYDKTQSEAYFNDEVTENDIYAVTNNSMYYQIKAGEIFDDTMLYKGYDNNVGQFYYNKKQFTENFDSITSTYNEIIDKYQKGNLQDTITELESLIQQETQIIEDYEALIEKLQTYDYEGIDLEYYNTYYGSNEGQYDMPNTYNLRYKQIRQKKAELDLLNKYDDMQNAKSNYENYTYYPYIDSQTTLNNIEAGVTDYYFAGWYYDSNYADKADNICYDPENPMKFSFKVDGNITLHAKWVDKKKGSEGLIFEKIDDGKVIVVDYLNSEQFDDSIYRNNAIYSKNVNDQGKMPQVLGSVVELQIPSAHKFTLGDGSVEICEVVGIVAGAFDENSDIINSVILPSSLEFIEENVFAECNLLQIQNEEGENSYLKADNDIALYQNLDMNDYDGVKLNDERTLSSYKGGVLLAYCNQSLETEYTVCNSLDNVVTRIGDNAFKGTEKLQTFNGGSDLLSIGENAFMGCHDLTTVNLPDTVVAIEAQAFKNCIENLTNINFVGSNLRTIGKEAFENTLWKTQQVGLIMLGDFVIGMQMTNNNSAFVKDEDGELVIENNCKYIIGKEGDTETFRIYVSLDNNEVVKILIYKAIKGIGDYAFNSYQNVNKLASLDTIEINSQNLEYVDKYAFNKCGGLQVVYFKDANNDISFGENIFAGCSKNISLMFPENYYSNYIENNNNWEEIVIGADILEINSSSSLVYYHKNSGEIISIPSYITEIDDNIFASGFDDIKQILLPDTLTTIGNSAFANCSSLISINIPNSVTFIGTNAFENCDAITNMTIPFIGDGTTNNTYFAYLFGGNSYSDDTKVPISLIKVVLNNEQNIVISDYAFANLNIKTIVLNENITSIGNSAFINNSELVSIAFPSYLTTIGDNAFENCISLTNIEFNSYHGVESIGQYAFKNCSSLKVLQFGDNLTSIGFGALQDCNQLGKLTVYFIGQNLDNTNATHFGYIFGATDYLDNANFIPASLYELYIVGANGATLSDNAFYGCTENLTIDYSTATNLTIKENAFNGSNAILIS